MAAPFPEIRSQLANGPEAIPLRVLFYHEFTEHLGIELLMAVLERAGHTCELAFRKTFFDNQYVDLPFLSRWLDSSPGGVLKSARAFGPDVLAFSTNIVNHATSSSVARRLREALAIPTVLGGALVTSDPQVFFEDPSFDFAIVGEGERAFPALLEHIDGRRPLESVPNLLARNEGAPLRTPLAPLVEDLDALPLPDREAFHAQDALHGLLLAGRGCPNACAFCQNSTYWGLYRGKGRWHRLRSPERVIEEAEMLVHRYGQRFLHIFDDCFPTDPAWLEPFARLYRARVGVPFDVMLFPSHVDCDTMRLLSEAGCVQVSIGIQSADEHFRRTVLKRRHSDADLDRVARLARRHGIRLNVDLIFDLPGDTTERMLQSAARTLALRPDSVHTFRFFPIRSTPLFEVASQEGHVVRDHTRTVTRSKQSINHNTVYHSPVTEDAVVIKNILPLSAALGLAPERLPVAFKLSRRLHASHVVFWLGLPFLDPSMFRTLAGDLWRHLARRVWGK